jgi:hypothetical protein
MTVGCRVSLNKTLYLLSEVVGWLSVRLFFIPGYRYDCREGVCSNVGLGLIYRRGCPWVTPGYR